MKPLRIPKLGEGVRLPRKKKLMDTVGGCVRALIDEIAKVSTKKINLEGGRKNTLTLFLFVLPVISRHSMITTVPLVLQCIYGQLLVPLGPRTLMINNCPFGL
jgi:hypothetical protein